MLFDALLTPLGEEQVRERHAELRDEVYDLVVTSPLTRAIQTARGVFGHSLARPVIIEALHRERVESSCDVGRPASIVAAEFPDMAFEHLDEHWWTIGAEPRENGLWWEPEEACLVRVAQFRRWLENRPEDKIAVVGHGTFFYHLTGHQFANCERLRWRV